MKYLICQDWENTHGNHAGMKHLCDLLMKRYGDQYKLVVFPDNKKKFINSKFHLVKKMQSFLFFRVYVSLLHLFKAVQLCFLLKKDDEVVLMEYLTLMYSQLDFAKVLKTFRKHNRLVALVHLTPYSLEQQFTRKEIKQWCSYPDVLLTLGSSLSNYFEMLGVDAERIITARHYVDSTYYHKEKQCEKDNRMEVIIMGCQMRDFDLIIDVVNQLDTINFVICKGSANVDYESKIKRNARVVGFVSEDELKKLMSDADISLNIMLDTVGSNVIVTSMAMGLALACSDVGSIRDYCDETNAVFFDNNRESIVNALKSMMNGDVERMKLNSKKKSRDFTVESFHNCLSCM